jgi:hypothetical protein
VLLEKGVVELGSVLTAGPSLEGAEMKLAFAGRSTQHANATVVEHPRSA